jgi:hypothetical protein
MFHHASASGSNIEMMKTFGLTTYSMALALTSAAGTRLADATERS